jgi:LDH2 family malate/lactate/ureidoglycolate dehydrogenase
MSQDYKFNEQVNVRYGTMLAWITKLYQACGMDVEDAHICADHAVMCDARGVYSHGALRTAIYSRRLLQGGTSPTAKPEVIKKLGATALVDGHNSMGQVSCKFAMDEGIKIAKEQGTSAVLVTGCNHVGACAIYVIQAADADMIGYCWNMASGNVMAPWGGSERQMGNNPYAIALPCQDYPHIVLDMALSLVARGKITMARKTKKPVPPDWALDVDGNPTTDADAGYRGNATACGRVQGLRSGLHDRLYDCHPHRLQLGACNRRFI